MAPAGQRRQCVAGRAKARNDGIRIRLRPAAPARMRARAGADAARCRPGSSMMLVAVQQQVEIEDRAGPSARVVRARSAFDRRASRRAAPRGSESRLEQRDGIDEIGLVGVSPRGRAIEPRGARAGASAAAVESACDRSAQRGDGIAEVAAEPDAGPDRRVHSDATVPATAPATLARLVAVGRRRSRRRRRPGIRWRARRRSVGSALRARTRLPRHVRRRRTGAARGNRTPRGSADARAGADTRLRWRWAKRDCSSQISCIGSENRRGNAIVVSWWTVTRSAARRCASAACTPWACNAISARQYAGHSSTANRNAGDTGSSAATRASVPRRPSSSMRRSAPLRLDFSAARFPATAPAAGHGARGRGNSRPRGRTGTASGIPRTVAPAPLRAAAGRARESARPSPRRCENPSFAASRTARSMRTGSSR